jgi:hypothetical protein
MEVTLHLTTKNLLSVIAGICVVLLAIIPLGVPADHLGWMRWQIAVLALAVVAVASLFWQACIQSREEHEAKGRERLRDERLGSIELQFKEFSTSANKAEVLSGSIQVAEMEPTKESALPSISTETDVIDGAVYRIAINPRTPAWEILKGVYQMRGEKPHVPCDVLVEMYLVNTSKTATAYIRDLVLSAEIAGQRVTLKCQQDFMAEDFNDQQWEYALKDDEERFGEREPLKRLFSEMPITLGPKQPTPEGWVRFLATDINPDEITPKSWQLRVVDSLGNEHPINKAVLDRERKGEVGLRRFRC